MSADQLLTLLFNSGVAVSIIATVLSLGMSFSIKQLVEPLKRWVLVLVMVAINCAVIPAGTWGIAKAFALPSDTVTGLTLAAIGAGTAASLKAAQLAKSADLTLAVSLVVVLQLVNLVAVPLWAGEVVSGASISGVTILKDLLGLVLLPLVIGLIIHARYAAHSAEWQSELVKLANLALGIALVAGIAVNWSAIVSLVGSRTLLASLVIAAAATLLGALAGSNRPGTRATTGLVSGLRFGSLGLIIIGTQLDGNPAVLGPAIVFSLVDLIVGMFVAIELGRRPTSTAVS